jgi:hypothetical protein
MGCTSVIDLRPSFRTNAMYMHVEDDEGSGSACRLPGCFEISRQPELYYNDIACKDQTGIL